MTTRGLLLAAPGSGVGKTSVACGILAALRRRGVDVRAAKCGPDYLDPFWLERASGGPCPNLDPWMAGEEGVRSLARGEGFLLVEGTMGLYDGICPESDAGSAAEVARILGIPVVLVVDASGAARTVAAVVRGLRDLGPVEIAGVVANRVGSASHADLVARALASCGLPPLLGHVRKDAFPRLGERHLGLLPPPEGEDEAFARLAAVVEEGIDLDALQAGAAPLALPAGAPVATKSGAGLRLGLSWDDVFRFAYPPVVAALEEAGVEVVRFSPLGDRRLPDDLDGLWLCGGYPEAHAAALAANAEMRGAVRDFCASGRAVLAECGGLLYLARTLSDMEGTVHSMCGVVPADGRMGRDLRALGYREARARHDLFLGAKGACLRGHEFHYGDLVGEPSGEWTRAWDLSDARGAVRPEGWWNGSVLATWFHGWLRERDVLDAWIARLRAAREGRKR